LPTLLDGIRRIEDLVRLVRKAGHELSLQWLPPDGWVEGVQPRRAAVLGRHAGFEWLGFETTAAAPLLASRVARRLERAGRLAAVLALDPESRLLAMSVSFPPRPLLVAELDHPSGLALRCLERLEGAAADGALAAAAHVARALDAEALGRRFFTTFRRTLVAMADSLPARLPAEDRHAIALLQLTRVLFLYFVQAKGWLDHRGSFLREEVDRVLGSGRSIQRHLLRPLFFGTLNQNQSERGVAARHFGRIPFLNGGLFEPHPLERRWRPDLSNELWRDAFDGLFERFAFTLGEDDGEHIAPDMLGRVFEGVMAPSERSESGTFYTPARLVRALVRASLAAYLARRLGLNEAQAEWRLEQPDTATRAILERITILDPAAGSGAFLLGALEQLSAVIPAGVAQARRQVVGRNLFGVDLNPAAVRLTELRLWLAVIERDDSVDPLKVPPLPNLDSVVRQGDSLFEPMVPGWQGAIPRAAAEEQAEMRIRLTGTTGREKAGLLRALRRAEVGIADGMLHRAGEATQARITDLVEQARSPTLFGGKRGLQREERKVLEALRGRRGFLLSLRRKLARDGALPWFHYQSQFADVFARGGFDLVIGNPPWVRAEELPAPVRQHLRSRYRWWGGRRSGRGFRHQPDVSIAFLERATELIAPGGTLGFLLPAKLATASYGSIARASVAERMTIHTVAELGQDPRASFEATAYPLALIVSKAAAPESHRARLQLDPGGDGQIPQRRLKQGPWVLAGNEVVEALEQVRADHPLLGARFRCQLGVKTGLNQVFIAPSEPLEPELLVWAIRGRDIRPFAVCPDLRLLWTHTASGRPLPVLPPLAAAYLARYRTELRSRRDYAGGPEWTLFRTGPAVAPHRVAWADLAQRLEAAALTGSQADRFIPLNSCYLMAVDTGAVALRLTAWLNCSWIRAAAASVADPAANGFRRFNARVMAGLPLPEKVLTDPGLLSLAQAARCGRIDQEALDRHCAQMLNLDETTCGCLAGLTQAGRHRR
jgi:hypothetical protein